MQCSLVDETGAPVKASDENVGVINHLGKIQYIS